MNNHNVLTAKKESRYSIEKRQNRYAGLSIVINRIAEVVERRNIGFLDGSVNLPTSTRDTLTPRTPRGYLGTMARKASGEKCR